MNKVHKSIVLTYFTIVVSSIFLLTVGSNAFGQTFETLENEKIFGYGGHDFNTFFFEGDLAGLDRNVLDILKDQTTYGDWSAAQEVAEKELISDQARLSFCQQLKNEGSYRPFVNCQEAIYDQFLYQNMYKTLATKKLIENAKKMVLQGSSPSIQPKGSSIPPKPSPQQEEQQLVDLCAQVLYDKRQSPLCQDLTPELKEKVQVEAQKLGVSVQKVEDYNQNTPPKPSQQEEITQKLSQQEEEQLIPLCAMNLYTGNQLADCEKLSPNSKLEVQVWAQKMGEKNGDTTTEKDHDDDDNDDDDKR